jgi:hypothetical protein
MKDPKGLPRWKSFSVTDGDYRWTTNKPLENTVKTVCKRCNETWMSDIESSAKLYLTPMISGIKTLLDKDSMAIIAKWMILRALISISHLPKNDGADQLFHLFYENKNPMPKWYVFAAAYEGTIPVHMEVNRFTHFSFSSFGVPKTTFRPNLLVNLLVGRIIFKAVIFVYPPLVKASLLNMEIPSWDASVVRMFPSPPKQIIWPTNKVITDDTILKFYQVGLPETTLAQSLRK